MPYEDKCAPRTGEKVYKHSGADQISKVFRVPCVMLVKTFPSELRTNSAFYFTIKKDPEWLV